MDESESRDSENTNLEKYFANEDLKPDIANEKWDLVKVTCTQEYNQDVQFGISFIRIYTDDAVVNESTPITGNIHI